MRRLALAIFGLAAGCNQIFGIKPTTEIDGGVDAAPITKYVSLNWGISSVNASGQPDPQLQYAAIGSETTRPAAPQIQVGPPLGQGALSNASYTTADGTVLVPVDLLGQHWRMVYMLPDDPVAHEVQWTVSTAYLVLPRLTRLDAALVPQSSGYSITPVGGPPSLAMPNIMTSGVYSWSPSSFTGGTFNFQYSVAAQQLTGPAGAPEVAKHDWIFASDWASYGTDQMGVSGWAMASIDLVANKMSTQSPQPTWTTKTTPDQVPIDADDLAGCTLLKTGMAGLFMDPPGCTTTVEYGFSPNTLLPGFLDDGAPLVMPLATATSALTTLRCVDPGAAIPLQRVLYVAESNTRIAQPSNIVLTSAVAVVTTGLAATYPAAVTRDEALNGTPLVSDNVSISLGSGASVELSYGFDGSADDVVITLYEIALGSLQPVRTYQLPGSESSVSIDTSLLQHGHTYVFELRVRSGYPNAGTGDYRMVSYPFGQTSKFSGTFIVQ